MEHVRQALAKYLSVLAVFSILASSAEGQFSGTEQSRTNIGVGPVSSGLGSGPGPGAYDVRIHIRSHRRYAGYADDGGHEEWWCVHTDTRANNASCGQFTGINIPGLIVNTDRCSSNSAVFGDAAYFSDDRNYIYADGVLLKNRYVRNVGPLGLSWYRLRKVEGSLNDTCSNGKWEWPSEGKINALNLPDSVRLTERDTLLLELDFSVANWTGARVSSKVRTQWIESDSGIFDDHSEWAYFNTGDMITRCLQGGQRSSWRTILSSGDNYYWHLCSEDGSCHSTLNPSGSGGLHYNIRTFYYVRCNWTPKSICGDGICGNGERCSSCPGDCPPAFSCGNGVCESSRCETALNCSADCQRL